MAFPGRTSMTKLGFIGTGTIGSALARELDRQGYPVVAVTSRRQVSAKQLAGLINGCRAVADAQAVVDAADFIFITTPDDIIGTVVAELRWRTGQKVVHCSGADTTEILKAARRAGAEVGVFHPLQSFAQPEQALANLPGSTFALEADEQLLGVLKEMAQALGGNWLELTGKEAKVLYHTAAVIASNYLVTLVKTATDLWQVFGVPAETATKALLPLLQGTLNNIAAVGIPQCLTGPISRGDGGTITKHLEALAASAPEAIAIYQELGRRTIPIALAKGEIDNEQGKELEAILKAAAGALSRRIP